MDYKEYLVELDNDKYGWSFLWNNTIKELNGLSTRLQIISCVSPIVLVYTDRAGRILMDRIEGIKTIEEDINYIMNV